MIAPRQCPVSFTARIVGGRWKPKILWALLRTEPQRYSALRRACPPVSDRILSKELKELESWGLITRREYSTIPPKTDYTLAPKGIRSARSWRRWPDGAIRPRMAPRDAGLQERDSTPL